MNGLPLHLPPFALLQPGAAAVLPGADQFPDAIVAGPRIGIAKAVDVPWGFGLRGSCYLSRAFATA